MHASDRTTIKTSIVDLMLQSPESLQKQLSEAVTVIGKYDFPEKWPELMSNMVQKFSSGKALSKFNIFISYKKKTRIENIFFSFKSNPRCIEMF